MTKPRNPVRYNVMIAFRERPEIIEVIHQAAREANVKPSQWLRSAALMSLTMQGFDTANIPDKAGK
jgi:hypothetical protein